MSIIILFLLSLIFIICGCLLWDFRALDILPLYFVPFLNNVIQLGFSFLIIMALKPMNIIAYICNSWIVRICGAMCYSLYIWHAMLMGSFLMSYSITNYLLYITFTFIIAAFSYRYIEFGKEKSLTKLFRISIHD